MVGRVRSLSISILLMTLAACGGGGGGGGTGTGGAGGNSSGTNYDIAITSFSGTTNANAGDTVTVNLTVENHGDLLGSPGVTIYLSTDPTVDILFDMLGTLSVKQIIFSPGESVSDTVTFNLPANLRSGTYYIIGYAPENPGFPDAISGDNVANFAITVSGTTCTVDAYEENDTPQTATVLNVGAVLDHNHCEDTNDWHSISVVQGTTYQFDSVAVGTNAKMMLELYDPDISLIAPIDGNALFGTSGNDARITWTATKSGTMYLRSAGFFNLMSSGASTEYQMSAVIK